MPQRIQSEIEQYIVNLYQQNFGVNELAKRYGLHRTTIQRVLIRNGIELRKRTPEHFYNVYFFDDYNPRSCYWAGFIAADGYIRSNRNTVAVHLSTVDLVHLQKLAYVTGFLGEPKVNGKYCVLSFNGGFYIEPLKKNFSIYPRKTYDISLPKQVPEHLMPHFLRGYFDADGSVFRKGKYAGINYSSGSKTMLNDLREYFYQQGIRIRNQIGKPPIYDNAYGISYGCANALKILDLLYADSEPLTRLDRKYELYQTLKRENRLIGVQ